MKKFFLLALLPLLLTACSSSKNTAGTNSANNTGTSATDAATSGDGLSFETAIVIDAKSETTGVDKEYVWLRKNYPGYKLIKQALVFNNNKPYDLMKIETAQGAAKEIYFDISKFFGKF